MMEKQIQSGQLRKTLKLFAACKNFLKFILASILAGAKNIHCKCILCLHEIYCQLEKNYVVSLEDKAGAKGKLFANLR